jgi:hypothetical protein
MRLAEVAVLLVVMAGGAIAGTAITVALLAIFK